jgi:hypothetical protein
MERRLTGDSSVMVSTDISVPFGFVILLKIGCGYTGIRG